MLTITATATALGGSDMFTRTGSDARVPGTPAGMGLPVGGPATSPSSPEP